jgi:hypothetical protein
MDQAKHSGGAELRDAGLAELAPPMIRHEPEHD